MLQENDCVGDRFRIIRHVNRGLMANAYEAVDTASGERFFLKEYTSPRSTVKWYRLFVAHQRKLARELGTSEAAHFCLLAKKTFESSWRVDAEGNKRRTPRTLYQAFTFIAEGKDLELRLQHDMQWAQRVAFAKALITGVVALHAAGIVHGDLKPANVQVIQNPSARTKLDLRLIDFDFAHFVGTRAPWEGHTGFVGTRGYWSPEHVRGATPSFASDVFTVSVMLCELLGKNRPYADLAIEAVPGWSSPSDAPPVQFRSSLGSASLDLLASQLISRGLARDPTVRPTAVELHSAIVGRTPAPASSLAPRVALESSSVTTSASIGSAIRLVAAGATHSSIELRVATIVGRTLLERFGAEARFAAEQQFQLTSTGNCQWQMTHITSATNATLRNGNVVFGSVEIAVGDRISIGSKHGGVERMSISIEGIT